MSPKNHNGFIIVGRKMLSTKIRKLMTRLSWNCRGNPRNARRGRWDHCGALRCKKKKLTKFHYLHAYIYHSFESSLSSFSTLWTQMLWNMISTISYYTKKAGKTILTKINLPHQTTSEMIIEKSRLGPNIIASGKVENMTWILSKPLGGPAGWFLKKDACF